MKLTLPKEWYEKNIPSDSVEVTVGLSDQETKATNATEGEELSLEKQNQASASRKPV
jgi:hypothetical protein